MTIHDQARVMANKGTSMSRALIYLHIYLDKDCNEAPQAHACRPLGRMHAGPWSICMQAPGAYECRPQALK